MEEYFTAKWTGSGKKVRGNPYRIFLHGTFFYLYRRVVLNELFIKETHIDDPAIFDQVISAMKELYGLHIMRYGAKEPKSVIATVVAPEGEPEVAPEE